MAITIDGTNGLTTDNGALKLDGTTLTVDETNNRVGIGTSSPVVALHIAKSDAVLRLEDTDTSNKTDIYQIGGGGVAISDGTTERMRIDSAGRVTKPYQPIASVSLSNGSANENDLNVDTRFDRIYVNNGNCYSEATGRFTAPVAGIYRISFSLLKASSSGTVAWRVFYNGAQTEVGAYSSSSGYNQMSGSLVYNMNANDYFTMQQSSGSFNVNDPGQDTWGCITFELIG